MTTNAEIAKVVNRAAELVEEGWCQGKNHCVVDGKDCHCMMSALITASDELDQGDEAIFDLCLDIIWDSLGKRGGPKGIAVYNDTPGRTQQEVVDTLRAVARELEVEA